MTDVIAALRGGGNIIPEIVVRVAAIERCDPALVATICQNESYGGRNVWGSDGVPTGNTYVKGAEVTRDAYLRYRDWMRAGSGRRQGVGPAQCTSAEFQDRADANGGCWDPEANLRSGARGMADRINAAGSVQVGARRYNGSGPAAEAYGTRFAQRYALWQQRLSGLAAPAGPAAPAGASGFRADYGQVGAHVHRLASFLNRMFPAYSKIPLDPNPAAQRYGPATVAVVREFARRSGIGEADGRNVGPKVAGALAAAGFRP